MRSSEVMVVVVLALSGLHHHEHVGAHAAPPGLLSNINKINILPNITEALSNAFTFNVTYGNESLSTTVAPSSEAPEEGAIEVPTTDATPSEVTVPEEHSSIVPVSPTDEAASEVTTPEVSTAGDDDAASLPPAIEVEDAVGEVTNLLEAPKEGEPAPPAE